jgi:hypothetical protein
MNKPSLNILFRVYILVFAFSTFSCASTYKPLDLAKFSYLRADVIKDTLRISYQYGVQESTGNRRYANKERKRGMELVALKIENLSASPITLTRENFTVHSISGVMGVFSPKEYSKKIKQKVGIHLLHALWGPWALSWKTDDNGETDFNFVYIPAGAIVGIVNAAKAAKANRENLATQERNEIWYKEISAGQTLHGLIAIPRTIQDSLSFSFNTTPGTKQYVAQAVYIPEKNPASYKHDFYVIMLNGKQYSIKTKIDISGREHFITATEADIPKIIKPGDTKSLSRLTTDGRQLLGVPNNNRWLFKTISGKINAFYFLAEDTELISDIQKGDGPIVPFSPQALLDMIGGDPDIFQMINRQKFAMAIKSFNEKNR